jgi:hypothetical protein
MVEALPPGAINRRLREEKLACRAGRVKGGFAVLSKFQNSVIPDWQSVHS